MLSSSAAVVLKIIPTLPASSAWIWLGGRASMEAAAAAVRRRAVSPARTRTAEDPPPKPAGDEKPDAKHASAESLPAQASSFADVFAQ
eukprot:2385436-Pleurochrysis_carterae.AAC.1